MVSLTFVAGQQWLQLYMRIIVNIFARLLHVDRSIQVPHIQQNIFKTAIPLHSTAANVRLVFLVLCVINFMVIAREASAPGSRLAAITPDALCGAPHRWIVLGVAMSKRGLYVCAGSKQVQMIHVSKL